MTIEAMTRKALHLLKEQMLLRIGQQGRKRSQLLLQTGGSPIAVALLAVLAGCGPALPPSKPLAALTPVEHAGREVYVERCGGCHYPNSSAPLHGPGLYAVLRNQYLPSGAPANDDTVSHTIVRGRGVMPAFGNSIDEQQMEELLAYLHTL